MKKKSITDPVNEHANPSIYRSDLRELNSKINHGDLYFALNKIFKDYSSYICGYSESLMINRFQKIWFMASKGPTNTTTTIFFYKIRRTFFFSLQSEIRINSKLSDRKFLS